MKIGLRFFLAAILMIASSVFFFFERGLVNLGGIDFVWYVAGLFFYFVYLYFLYKSDFRYAITSFMPVFYYTGMLISSVLISLGADLYEIGEIGSPNGVFWVVLFFAVLGIESAYFGFRLSRIDGGVNFRKTSFDQRFAGLVVLGVVGLSFFVLLVYGSPWSSGVNRVNYWGAVAPAQLSFVGILINTTFIIAAGLFLNARRHGESAGVFAVLVFVYIFLAVYLKGEKFSAFTMYASMWLLVMAFVFEKNAVDRVLRIMLPLFLGLVIFVGVIYVSMGLGFNFILTRIALQAQVLWSVFNESQNVLTSGVHFVQCGIECPFVFDPRDFAQARYLPPFAYYMTEETGTGLSGFMPSLSILFYGLPLSIVLHVLFSFFLGVSQYMTSSNLARGRYFRGYAAYLLVFFVFSGWFVGNTKVLLVVLLIFVFLVFMKFLQDRSLRYGRS